MLPASSNATVALLAGGLRDLSIDIVRRDLGDSVARLEIHDGRRVLYIDTDSDADELAWAMTEALRAALFGGDAAPSARQRPPLRLVG